VKFGDFKYCVGSRSLNRKEFGHNHVERENFDNLGVSAPPNSWRRCLPSLFLWENQQHILSIPIERRRRVRSQNV